MWRIQAVDDVNRVHKSADWKDGHGKMLDELIPLAIFDDDDILCFFGVATAAWFDNADDESIFAPLDTAMADYGCTTMKYYKHIAGWEVL